jgi:hypothetical protein
MIEDELRRIRIENQNLEQKRDSLRKELEERAA